MLNPRVAVRGQPSHVTRQTFVLCPFQLSHLSPWTLLTGDVDTDRATSDSNSGRAAVGTKNCKLLKYDAVCGCLLAVPPHLDTEARLPLRYDTLTVLDRHTHSQKEQIMSAARAWTSSAATASFFR